MYLHSKINRSFYMQKDSAQRLLLTHYPFQILSDTNILYYLVSIYVQHAGPKLGSFS